MTESRLHISEMERVCAMAPVGLCYVDANLRFRYINDWLARMNGLPIRVHAGARIDELIPDVAKGISSQLRRVLETGEPLIEGDVEAETPAHPGEPRCYRHSYYPDINDDGSVKGVCCVVRDVTEEKWQEHALKQRNQELEAANQRLAGLSEDLKRANAKLEQEALRTCRANQELEDTKARLERLALYDPLTELGNRHLFLTQLAHVIAIAARRHEQVALLALDLDGFKAINDLVGHAGGDEVLRAVGTRLRDTLREVDRKYRVGGDEFAVLLAPEREASDGAVETAKKVARQLSTPMEIRGHSCSVGVSIGVSVYPQHGEDPEMLFRKADAAMYEAKSKKQVVAQASDLDATTVLERLRLGM